jgi:hypothetical protein
MKNKFGQGQNRHDEPEKDLITMTIQLCTSFVLKN